MKKIAAYGSWKSPISSDLIVAETIKFGQLALDGEEIYWLEMRPSEAGRSVIVRKTADGQIHDVTPAPFNVRTRVHEYGGGAYLVVNGSIFFTNFSDQRVYRLTKNSEVEAITPVGQDLRYADYAFDRYRQCLIAVREDHTIAGREAVNTLVCIELGSETEGRILVEGHDFYSNPRISPDGTQLVWLSWNHPNMPWDGTELWIGEFQDDGSVGNIRKVAGGINESIFQPEWSPDGSVYFVSDRSGWWNLYRWQNGTIETLHEASAEFGRPQWVFRDSTYAFVNADTLICSYNERGTWRLARFDIPQRKFDPIDLPYTSFGSVQADQQQLLFSAGAPDEVVSVVCLDLDSGQSGVLCSSSAVVIGEDYLSVPETLEFPTEQGLNSYAFFYPPQNADYQAPEDERPPLLVISHGGPTAATSAVLNLHIQYWTSRGFAVLDVNYGGSSGYGRDYRQRLNGQWGVVDIDDCVNGARYLVETDRVDGKRLAIRGGSAGGYTTLGALAFRDVFHAGASYFGVSDAEALAKETHKFESRYLDSLIGPYPEERGLYRQRSPIHFAQQLACPVIFFQGLEDKIVPPNQAERMFEILREKGVQTAYVSYEGEQHGFRQAGNIKHSLDTELYFYSQIFGFELAEALEPINIENL